MVLIGKPWFVNGSLWSPLGVLIKCVYIWWKVWTPNKVHLLSISVVVLYICWHVHVFPCYSTACVWQCMFTCAGELLGRRGEQQFVSHVTGPGTAGNARLLVAALHPVWQPLHVAVAVQRVCTQSPASQKERGEWEQCLVLIKGHTEKSQNFNLRVIVYFQIWRFWSAEPKLKKMCHCLNTYRLSCTSLSN